MWPCHEKPKHNTYYTIRILHMYSENLLTGELSRCNICFGAWFTFVVNVLFAIGVFSDDFVLLFISRCRMLNKNCSIEFVVIELFFYFLQKQDSSPKLAKRIKRIKDFKKDSKDSRIQKIQRLKRFKDSKDSEN